MYGYEIKSKCGNCGKEVERGASKCPHCGVILSGEEWENGKNPFDPEVIEKNQRRNKYLALIILLIIIVVSMISFLSYM
ncbi:MAG: hypothetical protein IJI98_01495 [Methanosphaera sp.]|nr:hypothetical protein [Methanosphaera sp.]